MFDFDAGKLLIVGVIALIFIPPKDLPRVLRQAGQFVGKMRRMASEFQGQFMDAMREADMADLRQEARKLAEAARIDTGLGSVSDLRSHLSGAIEGKPVMTASVDASSAGIALADPNPELRRLTAGHGGMSVQDPALHEGSAEGVRPGGPHPATSEGSPAISRSA